MTPTPSPDLADQKLVLWASHIVDDFLVGRNFSRHEIPVGTIFTRMTVSQYAATPLDDDQSTIIESLPIHLRLERIELSSAEKLHSLPFLSPCHHAGLVFNGQGFDRLKATLAKWSDVKSTFITLRT